MSQYYLEKVLTKSDCLQYGVRLPKKYIEENFVQTLPKSEKRRLEVGEGILVPVIIGNSQKTMTLSYIQCAYYLDGDAFNDIELVAGDKIIIQWNTHYGVLHLSTTKS